MNKAFSRERIFGQAILMMVLMAFVFRALIPVGFMPAQAGEGAAIIVCSGYGENSIPVGDDGQPAHKASHDTPCGFAVNTAGHEGYEHIVIASAVPRATHDFVLTDAMVLPASTPYCHTRAPPILL